MRKIAIVIGLGLLIALAWTFAAVGQQGDSGTDVAISDAEMEDLRAVASQFDMSLQEAIDRYAWNDNFALAVSAIREAAPEAFTGAEIVDANNAWVAFMGSVPGSASDIISTFNDTYGDVSVEFRTSQGFTELELQAAIEAVHFAVYGETDVLHASTSFDFATGQINTVVVLKSTASDSVLNDLKRIASTSLTSATRSDIVDSITTTVVKSDQQILGGIDMNSQHLGGEVVGTCTSGFGTKNSSGVRGISTAGHCPNDLTDDGVSLTFKKEHEDDYGDFQWHTGSQTHSDDFYAGSSSSSEVNLRDVTSVGTPCVGMTLCRNGRVSNRDCQQVRKLDSCNGDACKLVQMGARQAAPGDSGGPVYWENTAYGLHQGWEYDPSWPFDRDLFSRADLIDEALDTSIATD